MCPLRQSRQAQNKQFHLAHLAIVVLRILWTAHFLSFGLWKAVSGARARAAHKVKPTWALPAQSTYAGQAGESAENLQSGARKISLRKAAQDTQERTVWRQQRARRQTKTPLGGKVSNTLRKLNFTDFSLQRSHLRT